MAKKFPSLSPEHKNFIELQKLFFVGTAMQDGKVNVSPKGMDTLRVLGENRIIWLNLTGSGNETAVHISHQNRMTLMWCSFEGKPLILRCYGVAKCYHEEDDVYQELVNLFPDFVGTRQIFDFEVDLVQSSCGFAVPLMDFLGERDILNKWAENRGREGIKDYWQEKNAQSIDNKISKFRTKD